MRDASVVVDGASAVRDGASAAATAGAGGSPTSTSSKSLDAVREPDDERFLMMGGGPRDASVASGALGAGAGAGAGGGGARRAMPFGSHLRMSSTWVGSLA